jgi:hypothetical protein
MNLWLKLFVRNWDILTVTRPFNVHPDFWFEKSVSVSNPKNFSGSEESPFWKPWFFFLGLHPKNSWVYTINQKKYRWPTWKKSGSENPDFFQGDLQNHCSGCRLKGWLFLYTMPGLGKAGFSGLFFFLRMLGKLKSNSIHLFSTLC